MDIVFQSVFPSIIQDFEEACSFLKKREAVHVSQHELTVSQAGMEVFSFLKALLQPFIDSYQVIRLLCTVLFTGIQVKMKVICEVKGVNY